MDPWPCRVCGKRPVWFGWPDKGCYSCHHFDGPGGSLTTGGPHPQRQGLILWNGQYGKPPEYPLQHLAQNAGDHYEGQMT